MSLLAAEAVSREFGGVHALDDVSFAIEAGEVFSIIGPNGAGKTTLLNVLTGVYQPSTGRVRFGAQDLTGRKPHEYAQRGIARTFQNLQVFHGMSALENVMVGRTRHVNAGLAAAMLRLPSLVREDAACREEAARLLDFVGLSQWKDAQADAMPYGALKRLEIARALAAQPRIVLLDEPAAGLNPSESVALEELIRRVRETGVTVVLVEHNMRLVMGVSDRLVVLDYGRKISEGDAAKVSADPRVIEAYLGTEVEPRCRAEAAA